MAAQSHMLVPSTLARCTNRSRGMRGSPGATSSKFLCLMLERSVPAHRLESMDIARRGMSVPEKQSLMLSER